MKDTFEPIGIPEVCLRDENLSPRYELRLTQPMVIKWPDGTYVHVTPGGTAVMVNGTNLVRLI